MARYQLFLPSPVSILHGNIKWRQSRLTCVCVCVYVVCVRIIWGMCVWIEMFLFSQSTREAGLNTQTYTDFIWKYFCVRLAGSVCGLGCMLIIITIHAHTHSWAACVCVCMRVGRLCTCMMSNNKPEQRLVFIWSYKHRQRGTRKTDMRAEKKLMQPSSDQT